MLAEFSSAFAQTWTQTSAPIAYWYSVAASADGNKVFADGAIIVPYVFGSTNSGNTWFQTSAPSNAWVSIACSADGVKLVAANTSSIYTSTNSGLNWKSNDLPNFSWARVVSSADGNRLLAVGGGLVFTTTDAGNSWASNSLPMSNATQRADAASSADGQRLIVVSPSGLMAVSTNGGVAWRQVTNVPGPLWHSVAMSGDGKKLIAVLQWLSGNNDVATIYTSTNFAQTWTSNNLPQIAWGSATVSADGKRMFVSNNSTNAFSTNDGAIWLAGFPGAIGATIVPAADGGVLFSTASGPGYAGEGGISRVASIIRPHLNIFATNNVSLAWTIPSTTFVLQQSSDLSNWSSVTNPPVLDFTNLQNQIALPLSASNLFFRLATP